MPFLSIYWPEVALQIWVASLVGTLIFTIYLLIRAAPSIMIPIILLSAAVFCFIRVF